MTTRDASPTTLRRTIASRIGLVLLPLLIVASLLWSTSGAGSRLHQAEAAVVNLDQGATVAGQPVHLGQDYALALKNQGGSNFTWRYGITLEQAHEGLASGRYGAAVVIPPSFSRTLTGTAEEAEQATLRVERSPVSGISDQLVTNQLSLAATQSLSGQVTKRYLDDVFVSTTELGQSLGHTTTLAEAASTGATELEGSAKDADKASAEVGARTAEVATGQASARDAANRAAASSRDAAQKQADAAGAAGTSSAAQDAQAKAVADAAARAKAVAEGAGKAKDSTSAVAGKASDAAAQGDATKKSADAVAAAAATSRTAAAGYADRVASVVKQQQDIAGQLAEASKQVKAYTDTTATVTQAVAKARRAVSAQGEGTAPATPAVPATPATPAGGDGKAVPASPTAPVAVPTATGAGKQLKNRADELRQLAADIDAVVKANAEQEPTTPTGLAGAKDAAAKNVADAQAVLDAIGKARTENEALVTTAREAAARARTLAEEATKSADQLSRSVKVIAPAPPAAEECDNNGQCQQYRRGYEAGIAAANSDEVLTELNKALDMNKSTALAAAKQATAAADAADQAVAAQVSLQKIEDAATTSLDSAKAVDKAVGDIKGGAAASVDGLKGTAKDLRTIAGQLTELADRLAQPATPGDQAGVAELKAQIAAALDAPEVARAVDALPAQGKALTEQAALVTAQADRNAKAMAAVDPAKGGAAALTSGTEATAATATAQAAVVEKLQGTLGQLTSGMDALGVAIGSLGTQSAAVQGSTAAASDRASALAGQVGQLTGTLRGLQAAATGAASDAASAEEKAVALQQQVSALQQSSGVLSRSTAEVVGQSSTQVDRTGAVVNALQRNATQVPSYDQATRERLTTAAGTPITTAEQDTFRNVGWVSMLMVLALWAGAMGLHSLLSPISRRATRSTEAAPRLLAREMMPSAAVAVAQGLAVAVVGLSVLHLPAGRAAGVTAALVLASVMFAAVNHTLVVFGRLWGRLLSVLFAIITGSGLVTQAHPGAMTVLRSLSPISPALDLVRSLMTGVPLGTGAALLLAFWLGAGCLFSALGILRAREPEPVRVPTVHETTA